MDSALRERIAELEELVADEPDDATARFMLATELAKAGEHVSAAEHFRAVIAQDHDYTAAWRGLGRALIATGDVEQAKAVFTEGLTVAERTRDYQSGKEMAAFLRRAAGEQA